MSLFALAAQHASFGKMAYFGNTTLHPMGLAALVVMSVLTLTTKRRNAAIPLIILTALVPVAQRVVIATVDLSLIRILILVGWVRVFSKGEHADFRWRPLDWAVAAWVTSSTIFFILQRGTEATVNSLGTGFDLAGSYFLLRVFLKTRADIERVLTAIFLISLPVALFFFIEKNTGRNFFSVFGGTSPITGVREGRLRCVGPFSHPILAGCFWAVLLPFAVVRLRRPGTHRRHALAACVTISAIVVFCASSTPLIAAVGGFMGLGLWGLRQHMQPIRWGLLVGTVTLHMVMEAPVWHLIGRLRIVGGSTGYHRYRLIDAAVHHFGDWWMVGVPSTAYWGRQLFDVTNQYLREGVRGGLLTMVLFIAVLGFGFRTVGQLWRRCPPSALDARFLIWAAGASLLGHALMFIAVSMTYSLQNVIVWNLVLASIGSLDAADLGKNPARRARRVPSPPEPVRRRLSSLAQASSGPRTPPL